MVKPIFVAEFTTNHAGNLNLLLAMVEAAAGIGVDYIKMQMKDVESFYTKEKLDSKYESPYGETYRDYRTIFEFDHESFNIFNKKCEELGIAWFSTVQDMKSLKYMLSWNLPIYKIASYNARNDELLSEMAMTIPKDRTVVVSVAGCTFPDIENIVGRHFIEHKVYLLHCVAEYPCVDDNLRLGNISILKQEFEDERIKIGYSCHSNDIVAAAGAAKQGAALIEKHFCISRRSFVHHIECALTPHEFKNMMIGCSDEVLMEHHSSYLTPASFSVEFGASPMEKSFLEGNTYGQDYLNKRSDM